MTSQNDLGYVEADSEICTYDILTITKFRGRLRLYIYISGFNYVSVV